MSPLGHVAVRLGATLAIARNQARRMFGLLTTAPVPGKPDHIRLLIELHDGRELHVDLDQEQARMLAEQLIVRVHLGGSTLGPEIEARPQAKQ